MLVNKEPDVLARMLRYKSAGPCDNCGHDVGYYGNGTELIHYMDLFPDDELADDIGKTHCKNPSRKAMDVEKNLQVEILFDKLKRLASQRNDALGEFQSKFEEVFGYEAPLSMESDHGIDWQDVLVWGIADASFEDFLKDVGVYKQNAIGKIEVRDLNYGHCGICKVWFNSVDEAKSHFSSEEHKTKAGIIGGYTHFILGAPDDDQEIDPNFKGGKE